MRFFMTVMVTVWLIGTTPMLSYANTMNGTGTVNNVTKNLVTISGISYTIHKNVHVGIYRQSGTKVIEETRSISSVEPGQDVRYKIIGNMVLELIILKR